MKKIVWLMGVLFVIAGLAFTSWPARQEAAAPQQKACTGYTVIEASKGIDCHGDTIPLIKRNGYFEVAGRFEPPADGSMLN